MPGNWAWRGQQCRKVHTVSCRGYLISISFVARGQRAWPGQSLVYGCWIHKMSPADWSWPLHAFCLSQLLKQLICKPLRHVMWSAQTSLNLSYRPIPLPHSFPCLPSSASSAPSFLCALQMPHFVVLLAARKLCPHSSCFIAACVLLEGCQENHG